MCVCVCVCVCSNPAPSLSRSPRSLVSLVFFLLGSKVVQACRIDSSLGSFFFPARLFDTFLLSSSLSLGVSPCSKVKLFEGFKSSYTGDYDSWWGKRSPTNSNYWCKRILNPQTISLLNKEKKS